MIPAQIVIVIAGLIGAVLRQLFPGFPLSDDQIFMVVVFLLGLVGVVVQARFRHSLTGADGWLHSKALWLAVAAVANIVLHSYLPNFPLLEADIAGLIFFVLAEFGVNPEVRALRSQVR